MASTLPFPRNNNLEWLRLLFAVQVLVQHAAGYTGVALPAFIDHFPGVPAFFFVSGFLIYASYLNAPGARYFQNRFLRLYPGLVFVTVGGVIVAVMAKGLPVLRDHAPTLVAWFFAQTTLGQAYNPALFRDIGVGVINGSLWTITTEILFYLCVPLLAWAERRIRYTVLLLTGVSFAIYALAPHIFQQPIYRGKTFYDALALTPIVWGWMFGTGILAVKYFAVLRPYLKWLPLAAIPLLTMVVLKGEGVLFGSFGNRLGLLYYLCYVSLVLCAAFAVPYLRLRFDFSYGVYIWHMVVINALLVLGLSSMPLVIVLTVVLAALSWFLVERPMLRLKRSSLRRV